MACALGNSCRFSGVALPLDSGCIVCERTVHHECSMTIADFASKYLNIIDINGINHNEFDEETRICKKCEISQAHGERD